MGTFSRRLHFRSRICNFDCIHPASAAAAGCFVLAGGLGAVLCALPRPRAAPQSFQVGLRGGWYLACPCSRWLASEEVIPHAHRGECWTSRGPCERIEVGRVCSPWILVFLVMMYAVPGFVSRELRAKPRRGRNLGWEPRKFEARCCQTRTDQTCHILQKTKHACPCLVNLCPTEDNGKRAKLWEDRALVSPASWI